jgi:hypothetical protein
MMTEHYRHKMIDNLRATAPRQSEEREVGGTLNDFIFHYQAAGASGYVPFG